MLRAFTALLLLVLLACPAYATTYYFDATGGLDGNSGTAEGSAWQTITKMSATTFSAGDNILLKKGETWTGMWSVLGSGTAGNKITIGSYGSGAQPIIDANSANARAIYLNANDYITIDGIHAKNATTANIEGNAVTDYVTVQSCTLSGGASSLWFDAGTGVLIDSNTINQGTAYGLTFFSSGANRVINSTVSNNVFNGVAGKTIPYGIYMDAVNGLTFSGNQMYNWTLGAPSYQVYMFSTTGATFSNNILGVAGQGNTGTGFHILNSTGVTFSGDIAAYNTADGFGFNGSGVVANNILADHNGSHNIQIMTSGTVIINNSTSRYSTAQTGIKAGGSATVTLNNFTAEYNANSGVYQLLSANVTCNNCTSNYNAVDGFSANNTGMLTCNYCMAHDNGSAIAHSGDGYTSHDTSTLNVKHSIGYSNWKSCIAVTGATSGTIYNNSCYNNYNAGIADDYGIWLNATGTWNVKNNITANHRYELYISATAVAGGATITSDYNSFYDSRGGSAFHYNGIAYNFANYKTASSKDTNSINADPLFRSTITHDFHLLLMSPAIYSGTDVSLTADYDGKPIRGATPNMGAYESWPGVL